jgi:hypothetical protein
MSIGMEEEIRKYGRELGADTVGFASVENYRSPKSPDLKTILPNARSLVVFGYREVDGALESGNARVSMAGRMAVMDLAKKNDYPMARFIGATPEEQKSALRDPLFLSLYQAPFMGFQYACYQCETVCPAGRKKFRINPPKKYQEFP